MQPTAKRGLPVGPALACMILGNLLDAAFTLVLLEQHAYEVNPVMAFAHAVSPSLFITVKLGIIIASLFLLWTIPGKQKVKLAVIRGGALLYLGIVAYHCYLVMQLQRMSLP